MLEKPLKKGFYRKLLANSLNFCLVKIVEIASCLVKETYPKLSPNLTIGERLNEGVKNIKVGFFG